MSKELLIKGGHVVTVDPDLGDLPAGDVLVADGLITAVGPDLEPTTTAAEVIEAAGRLVIPGMVDTHRHVWMGMALRGPCFTSAERNAEDYAFARDLGLPISVHVGMAGTADAVTTLQRYSLLGADVNYVHGNMLTDREFDLIAETQGTVTIAPSTDMLMQFGTFPATGPAVSRGIVSGFGIDTICSAGNDLFSEMRLALAAERSRANAPALASGKQVPTVDLHQRDMLRLATIDGARVG